MRNRNLLLMVVMGVLVAACSSKQTSSDSTSSKELWDAEDTSVTKSKDTSAPAAPATPPPVETRGSDDPWADLAVAITAQDDERIKVQAERILDRVPGDVRALNALAMVHYRRGRFDYAAHLLGNAMQTEETRAELHSNMGLVSLARGEQAVAIRNFRRAIELNPSDSVSSANLGSIYVLNQDFVKAKIVLETAYRNIKDVKVANNYAIALTATGDTSRARSVFQDALKANPNQKELLLNYAILLVDHLSQYKEGLDVINRLKFVGPPPESRSRLSALENKAQSGLK